MTVFPTCLAAKKGDAAQLSAEEPQAPFTHCHGHALNLVVGDTIKQSKVCCDAMDFAFEVSRLIRFSPKCKAFLTESRPTILILQSR